MLSCHLPRYPGVTVMKHMDLQRALRVDWVKGLVSLHLPHVRDFFG